MKNIYLEIMDDYFKSTWKIVECTDNKGTLTYIPIKIINETYVDDNVIVTYITNKRKMNATNITKITNMYHVFNNCDILESPNDLDTLYEIATYIRDHASNSN